jgi:AbiV family abortive infection protein
MDVSSAVLLKGAWFALEQCGILLQQAMLLYRAKAYSCAAALAMIGREELGKSRMLIHEWRKSQETGKSLGVEYIQKLCEDHVEKQRSALLGLTFTGEAGSAIDRALRTMMGRDPKDTEYQEAEKVFQTALKSVAKRAPEDRHAARMRALYVDLSDSGTEWNRPLEFPQTESRKLLGDAANDYAGQSDRFRPDFLREMGDQPLADALDAWTDRPKLPPPVWPE